ncbi:MAG: transcriptional regulator [Confluentimicrobium sp.]|uniref:winged helix-turn-helix transcriptional regulator n=1 Tax=Actibacterium sp. TaxID=1872125 RepID=UPI000C5DC169|nr:helix-turn-helix domain-containing protein [Actibacterium sp.]MBC57357.1 transcriptional regulator [Actibacterium sp.]|tara:strand:- start:3976 stop:4365 length:390 start_codon:yes stop_codon:yes gene_type:complete
MAQTTPQNGPADEAETDCRALGRVLERIGNKWTVMVVGVLSQGPMRFNAIMRTVGGVSHRMLTLTLRGLERDGLVTRTVYPTVPPKVEYALTETGQSLIVPLSALARWAEQNRPRITAAQAHYDAAQER